MVEYEEAKAKYMREALLIRDASCPEYAKRNIENANAMYQAADAEITRLKEENGKLLSRAEQHQAELASKMNMLRVFETQLDKVFYEESMSYDTQTVNWIHKTLAQVNDVDNERIKEAAQKFMADVYDNKQG